MPQALLDHLDIWTSAIETRSTAGRGSSNKLNLYGIKKLRELILELAVRGQLVPQDPTDEPASVLLEKIAAEKARLIKAGKLKKQQPLPPITDDEKPFELPEGWVWTRWNAVAQKIGDIDHKMPDEVEQGIPYVSPRDFYPNNRIDFDSAKKISQLDFERLAEKIQPQRGDIIFPRYGTIGENMLVDTDIDFLASYSCCVIKTMHAYISPEYQFIFSISGFVKHQSKNAENKTTQANVGIKSIQNFVMPLPPLAEQHRIVAKVNKLMSLCDALEQAQESSISDHQRLVENLLADLANPTPNSSAWLRIATHFDTLFTTEHSIDQLRQSTLQLAVMGKLVPQDPTDEPASVLLEKIAAEKARLVKAGKLKKEKPLPPIAEDEKPFELPQGWEWCRVWDVAELITSGSRDWAKYYSDSGAIFVTMGNLSRGDYKLRMESIRYVRPPSDGEGLRTKLIEGDLLISITGDVGNLGLIPKNFGDAYINQHTCLLRFMLQCRGRYFPELMRSPLAKYQFDAPQRGIKNSFRLGDVGGMIVPLPPLAEQQRVVAKVDELMMLCDQLKARIRAAQTTQLHLADAQAEQVV